MNRGQAGNRPVYVIMSLCQQASEGAMSASDPGGTCWMLGGGGGHVTGGAVSGCQGPPGQEKAGRAVSNRSRVQEDWTGGTCRQTAM